jgi:hypothetical protein
VPILLLAGYGLRGSVAKRPKFRSENIQSAEKYFEVLGNLEPNFQQICLKRAENVSN